MSMMDLYKCQRREGRILAASSGSSSEFSDLFEDISSSDSDEMLGKDLVLKLLEKATNGSQKENSEATVSSRASKAIPSESYPPPTLNSSDPVQTTSKASTKPISSVDDDQKLQIPKPKFKIPEPKKLEDQCRKQLMIKNLTPIPSSSLGLGASALPPTEATKGATCSSHDAAACNCPQSGDYLFDEDDVCTSSLDPTNIIQNVWASNFEEEMKKIKMLLATGKYTYIALDTEFPGVICRPADKTLTGHLNFPVGVYARCRANCNLMQPIQLGFSLFDEKGRSPRGISTWQLNLKFDLKKDIYSPKSIQLLKNSGVDFDRLASDGIELKNLPKWLVIARIAMNPRVKWIVFHGNYDFGYMLRIMSLMQLLPNSLLKFTAACRRWFPNLYDVKVMMCQFNIRGGLQRMANKLKLQRVGTSHQAGSDALLAGNVFFEFRKRYYNGKVDHIKLSGRLHGYNMNYEELQKHTFSIPQIPGIVFTFNGLGHGQPAASTSRKMIAGSTSGHNFRSLVSASVKDKHSARETSEKKNDVFPNYPASSR